MTQLDKRQLLAVKRALETRLDGLRLYKPLPAVEPFHRSSAVWRILIGGNRSGKTLAAAVEVARALRGMDPYKKYPRNGVCVIIGLDTSHHGMIWRKLTSRGEFCVLYDPEVNDFRVPLPREDDPTRLRDEDLEKRDEWIEAGPLLPIGFVKIARPNVHEPKYVVLKNGWTIVFATSLGKPKQGEHYDLVWIDEQIQNPDFFYEAARGLLEVSGRRGFGIWSAAPQHQNRLLWSVAKRADEFPKGFVEVFELSFAANPYVAESSKQLFELLLPDDEKAIRIDGKYAVDVYAIYSMFDIERNTCERFAIPDDWTHYLAVDPGTSCCGTVMAAVNPEDNRIYVYDAVTLRSGAGDAYGWADMIASRPDAYRFCMWFIDRNAGRARPIGSSETVAKQYFTAALSRGVRPNLIGPLDGFYPGSNDPNLRIEKVRHAIRAAQDSKIEGRGLVIFNDLVPLVHQLTSAQFDRKTGKRVKGEYDLLDALEYLISGNPCYFVQAPAVSSGTMTVYEMFKSRQHRTRLEERQVYGL